MVMLLDGKVEMGQLGHLRLLKSRQVLEEGHLEAGEEKERMYLGVARNLLSPLNPDILGVEAHKR